MKKIYRFQCADGGIPFVEFINKQNYKMQKTGIRDKMHVLCYNRVVTDLLKIYNKINKSTDYKWKNIAQNLKK